MRKTFQLSAKQSVCSAKYERIEYQAIQKGRDAKNNKADRPFQQLGTMKKSGGVKTPPDFLLSLGT